MYKKITPEEAKKIIDTEKDIVILDVREEEEFVLGHVENAVLLPVDQVEELAETKLPNKSQKILVCCKSGRRSREASFKLISLGYTNVLDFGGLVFWPYEICHV